MNTPRFQRLRCLPLASSRDIMHRAQSYASS